MGPYHSSIRSANTTAPSFSSPGPNTITDTGTANYEPGAEVNAQIVLSRKNENPGVTKGVMTFLEELMNADLGDFFFQPCDAPEQNLYWIPIDGGYRWVFLPTNIKLVTESWGMYGSVTDNKTGFEEHLALLKCESSSPPTVLVRHQNRITKQFHSDAYELELHNLESKPYMPHPDGFKPEIFVQGLRLKFFPLDPPSPSA